MKTVFLLVFALVYAEAEVGLPNYIKQCYRNDPGLSDCIRENMESLREIYPEGALPELGIPSFNPALNPKTVYNLLGFYYALTDFKIWHLDNYTINSVEFDTKHFNLDFYYPSLGFKTHYRAKGKLLMIELDSEGVITGNYTSMPMKYKATLDKEIRNGTQYLTLKSSEVELSVAKFRAHFTNLSKSFFMNTIANKLINMSQGPILKQFAPLLGDIIKYVFDVVIRNVFRQIPLDVLLPEKN